MFFYPWLTGQKTEADLGSSTTAVDLRDGEELFQLWCYRRSVIADIDSRQGPHEGFGSGGGLSEEVFAGCRRRCRERLGPGEFSLACDPTPFNTCTS